MDERFRELPKEKRKVILNAAIEVFAQYDYKRASTDLIACKAGISKGLLFYYFRNKKELYMTAYRYAEQAMVASIVDKKLLEITDFFEMIRYAAVKKLKLLSEIPYILDFGMRSYYSEKEEVSDDLRAVHLEVIDGSYGKYFGNINFSRFKEGTDPGKIFRMLVWMMDGYLHEQQMHGRELSLDDIGRELDGWMDMLKRISYKEEYL